MSEHPYYQQDNINVGREAYTKELKGNYQAIPSTIVMLGRRINLLDYKAANQRSSLVLAFFTLLLLVAIAYLAAIVFDPAMAALFVAFGLFIGAGQNLIAYYFSDQMTIRASGALPATIEQHRYLINITEAVALGAGVPMPKVYVLNSPAPNAFATGRNPQHSAIVVSTGLIALLDRQELEGVVAHELSHIKNYDILYMGMLAATIGAIIILRDMVLRSMRYGSAAPRRRESSDQGGQAQAIAYLLLIVLLVLAPFLATLLRLAVSRKREYIADATGAYITRNPEGLAKALEKVRDYSGAKLEVSEGVQHMFFTNPIMGLNASRAFATHPPIDERISRLRRM